MEVNQSLYKNICKTVFSKMVYLPKNSYDMLVFFLQHNGSHFLPKKEIKKAILLYESSVIQLEAFFILTKCMQYHYKCD